MLLLAQIGDDQARAVQAIDVERAERQKDRQHHAFDDQLHLALAAHAHPVLEQRRAQGAIGGLDKGSHLQPDHLRRRQTHKAGERRVGVQDSSLRAQRHRPFAHRLDQDRVGVLGAAQHVDARTVAAAHRQSIDLALADRPQQIFGVLEPRPHGEHFLRRQVDGLSALGRLVPSRERR